MKAIFKTLTLATLILTIGASAFADPPKPVDTTIHEPLIVVACIGDSITAGGGVWSFPAQLGRMLDDKWRVDNYGINFHHQTALRQRRRRTEGHPERLQEDGQCRLFMAIGPQLKQENALAHEIH